MSMEINTAAPVSPLLSSNRSEKNVETEGLEKPEQARRSAVSASLDRIDLGEEGITITDVSRQQGAEPAARRVSAPSADRVEISKEGQAALSRLQARKGNGAAAASNDTVSLTKDAASKKKDLSEYTDTGLKQMYYKGEITRQQYEKETGETLE